MAATVLLIGLPAGKDGALVFAGISFIRENVLIIVDSVAPYMFTISVFSPIAFFRFTTSCTVIGSPERFRKRRLLGMSAAIPGFCKISRTITLYTEGTVCIRVIFSSLIHLTNVLRLSLVPGGGIHNVPPALSGTKMSRR